MTQISFPCGCTAAWDEARGTFYLEMYCSRRGEIFDRFSEKEIKKWGEM